MTELSLTMVTLAGEFPVGAVVKSRAVTTVSPPVWGAIIANDGVTFDVRWDYSGVVERFVIADEARKAEARLQEGAKAIATAMGAPA